MNAIAAQADLTTGAFYRYFRDLGELLDELAGAEVAKVADAVRPVLAQRPASASAFWVLMVDAILGYLENDRVGRVLFQHRRRVRAGRARAGYSEREQRPWVLLSEYLDRMDLLSQELDDFGKLRIELLWLQTEELLERAFREGAPADPQVCRLMRETLQVQATLL